MAFEPSSGGSGGYVSPIHHNFWQAISDAIQRALQGEGEFNSSGWGDSYVVFNVTIDTITRNYVTHKISIKLNWNIYGYGVYVGGVIDYGGERTPPNRDWTTWMPHTYMPSEWNDSGSTTISVSFSGRGTKTGSIPITTYHQAVTGQGETTGFFGHSTITWVSEDPGLEYFTDQDYTGNFTEFIRQRDNTENFAILNKLLYYYKGYKNILTSNDTEELPSIPDIYSLVNNAYSTKYRDIINAIYNASLASSTGLSVPNGQATGVTATQFNAARTIVNNIGQLNQYSIVPKLEPYYIVIRTLGYNV